MKEKIFEMSEHGPFRAKVDERYHKLRQDYPDDGWVTGYLYRDLHNGEVLPHIFNCPCRWIVQEETIEPVGFYIAQWVEIERDKDGFIEEQSKELLYNSLPVIIWDSKYKELENISKDNWCDWLYDLDKPRYTHYMPIVPPKED
jgi:hypothetical protein